MPLGDRVIGWVDLTPLDQFSVRGLDATRGKLEGKVALVTGGSIGDSK
jgi:hypothetical protein